MKICLISGLIGLISEPTELWEEAACKDIKFILEWWVEKKDSELAYAVCEYYCRLGYVKTVK